MVTTMREDSILLKHPALFSKCFDFSPPRGWRGIVEALCDELAKTGCKVVQVKEKFGGLRVYAHGEGDVEAANAAIAAAEDRAWHTCQDCGASGAKLRRGGWARTLCDGCAK